MFNILMKKEVKKNVRKLCHLYCKCKDDQECFVYTSRSHSYIQKRIDGIQLNCTCKSCLQVKYVINFRAYKICVKSISANISQHLVPLDDYLKSELTNCKPFFYFFNQKVNIKLDNPLKKYINNIRKVD